MNWKAMGVAIVAVAICSILLFSYYQWVTNSNDESERNRVEVVEKIRDFKLRKLIRHRDLVLEKEDFAQISEWQKYVTPDNQTVYNYVLSNQITTTSKAYNLAVNWIWVSDQTLHGKSEEWLFPQEFIQNTPMYPSNPIPGNMVSDCESQAYTLVSILESIGISKQNVRVVVGKVNFSGEIGGHAWVQVYENGKWFELEATSGPFWDDDDEKLVNNTGFPYNYFKNRPYPVIEYWAFFNDRYYHNPHSGKSSPDLPSHWLQPYIIAAT